MIKLAQPLYHGTRASLLPSIRSRGLGGHNIVREWGAAEFLSSAWRICESHPDKSELEQHRWIVDRMLADWDSVRSTTSSNWRHGAVYLTTSLRKALSYGRTAAPEMVAYAFQVLETFAATELAVTRDLLRSHPAIADWRANDARPVVLAISDIDPMYLRTEGGGDAENALSRLQDQHTAGDVAELISEEFEYVGNLPWRVIIEVDAG